MSPYRIGGAVAAVVLILLLALVSWRWASYSGLVTPSVSIAAVPGTGGTGGTGGAGGEQPRASALDVLAQRTQLQADEVNRPPASFPLLARDESFELKPGRVSGDAERTVREWQKDTREQGLATPSQDIFGLSSLPYRNAGVLEQPEGRDWRADRNGRTRFGGGWLIFGVSLALALFLFARGRIRIAEGPSGETVPRFNALERANHWMTSSAFVVMALTGLVILYGKPLLLPLVGEHALGWIAWWSAWLHMSASVPFVLGIALMAVLWLRQNLITRLDLEWLRRFGGFLHDSPDKPSAARFNAGQKLVFWGVLLGGLAALATGLALMFPFRGLGYDGMQWAQLLHAAIGLAMVALIIGHIYIGTVGMEGAIDAMWSGRVDRNWAKEHHDLWYPEVSGERREEDARGRRG